MTVTSPSELKQVGGVMVNPPIVTGCTLIIDADLTTLQLLASVTVTEYVSVVSPVIDDVVSPPGDHKYVKGGLPVKPVTKTLPMEYAVEWSRLIELQMEGSIG